MNGRSSRIENRHVFISYARDGAAGQNWAMQIQRRLELSGIPSFRDETDVELGRPWPEQLLEALDVASALICVVSASVHQSSWVERELLYADRRLKDPKNELLILPVQVEVGVSIPFAISEFPVVDFTGAIDDPWEALLGRLADVHQPAGPRRRIERAYLQDLLYTHGLVMAERLYTPLAGEESKQHALVLPEVFMDVGFDLVRDRFRQERQTPKDKIPFEDVLEALRAAPRLVVLGEPGAGKTFALQRIAAEQARKALLDPDAPLPLFVPLKEWIDENGASGRVFSVSLQDFISAHCMPLGALWLDLRDKRRISLLLDGLNELPTARRSEKSRQIQGLVQDSRLPMVVTSCREKDYVGDLRLELDSLTIRPLDPRRVLRFLVRYLQSKFPQDGAERAEVFFWQLAGGEDVRESWLAWQEAGADLELFWSAEEIPRENPDVYGQTIGRHDEAWRRARFDERSLMRLAANPYLLRLLLVVYLERGPRGLPKNRATLIGTFVAALKARENKRQQDSNGIDHPGSVGLEEALGALAWSMQTQVGGRENVQLAIAKSALEDLMTPEQLDLARAANLLEVGDTVRFTHQLLQEYFTALEIQSRIQSEGLSAAELWPKGRWWERTGWEEAAVFLAGLEPEGPSVIIDWLKDAQPEVLVQCLAESGCAPPNNEQLADLQARWLARLDPEREPAPEGRHAVGLALGRRGLDDRPGVGLRSGGLPDIDWVEIPAGEFLYGESKEKRHLDTFWMARYPITDAQYQAFIDDGGYAEDRWWKGLAERIEVPDSPTWTESNRPRETVTWYEAVAFCSWLTQKFRQCGLLEQGHEIRVPTETQWEKAARGTDGREYPWGDGYRAGYANINEKDANAGIHYIHQTTVVGLYPQGASPYGVEDLAGNVWEWCLNKYDQPDDTELGGTGFRVVRGGSWIFDPGLARAVLRLRDFPGGRYNLQGFRVVRVSPMDTDH